jgi:hypothetical protein
VQAKILDELDTVSHATGQLDLSMAERLISERLTPI